MKSQYSTGKLGSPPIKFGLAKFHKEEWYFKCSQCQQNLKEKSRQDFSILSVVN